MDIVFKEDAQEDILFWKRSGNVAVQKKISALLADMQKHPYSGIGKPEALKYELVGFWSRRINNEHRIIYNVEFGRLVIYSLKGHYDK